MPLPAFRKYPEDINRSLYLSNYWDREICYHCIPSAYENIRGWKFYPDTTCIIAPNADSAILGYRSTVAGLLSLETAYFSHKNDSLLIVLVDKSLCEENKWQAIDYSENKSLQCYFLSREDVLRLNYHLTFPPSPAMKDICMPPAYGTYGTIGIVEDKTELMP